jgi:DNA-binding MarR family transcriptional regulator
MNKIEKSHGLEMGRICAVYNLRRTTRLVSQAYDRALRPLGLKITQFSLLVAAHTLDDLVLTKLAKNMGMDRTTLSRNLRLLEKKGMVRIEKGEDQRELRVALTDQGYGILKQAIPLWEKAQERVMNGVGATRYEGILTDLRALAKVARQ